MKVLKRSSGAGMFIGSIQSVEQVTDENKTRVLGAAGWGLGLGFALNPLLGIFAAAAQLVSKKKIILAAVTMRDGGKFLVECKPHEFKKLLARSL